MWTAFLLVILNSLFGCVCQPIIDEYDDDDDEEYKYSWRKMETASQDIVGGLWPMLHWE